MITRRAFQFLDASCIAVASWTVAFYLCSWFEFDRLVALPLAATIFLLSRRLLMGSRTTVEFSEFRRNRLIGLSQLPRKYAYFVGILVSVLLVWTNTSWFWCLVCISCVISGLTSLSVRQEEPKSRKSPLNDDDGVLGPWIVQAAALLWALASAISRRPDGDDVFLVRLSAYIENTSGRFPIRDVIFGPEILSSSRPTFPVTSIEALYGIMAKFLPISAPTLVYLVVGPLVCYLSVISLYRLARCIASPLPAITTLTTLLLLAFNAQERASFGNFSAVRSWQGKAILLTVVLPTLIVQIHDWQASQDRRRMALPAFTAVAGLGFSTSAIFLVPLLAAVVFLASAQRYQGLRLRSVILSIAASAGVAALGLMMRDGPTALGSAMKGLIQLDSDAASLKSSWGLVVGGPQMTVLAGLALVVAPFWVFRGFGRLLVGYLLLVFFGLLAIPQVHEAIIHVSGIGPVAWRLVWLLPLPLILASVIVRSFLFFGARRRGLLGYLAPLSFVVVLALLGRPIFSPENGTALGRPSWKLTDAALTESSTIVDLAVPGTRFLAPEDIEWGAILKTTKAWPINPRSRYLYDGFLAGQVDGAQDERSLLMEFVNGTSPETRRQDIARTLTTMDVTVVALRHEVSRDHSWLRDLLIEQGFVSVTKGPFCEHFTRALQGD